MAMARLRGFFTVAMKPPQGKNWVKRGFMRILRIFFKIGACVEEAAGMEELLTFLIPEEKPGGAWCGSFVCGGGKRAGRSH